MKPSRPDKKRVARSSGPLRRLAGQRGVALLVTLSVIAVLVPATLALNRYVRTAAASNSAAKDRLALVQMADAGIHAAMALLVSEKAQSEADSLAEDWANPDRLSLLAETLSFERGGVTILISDERSRIQVNAIVDFPDGRSFVESQRQLWDRLLTGLAANSDDDLELDAAMVINALKDWLDSGDDDAITGLSGAESDYYEELDPPYTSRNGPILHLDEMARIRGLDRDVLYGSDEISGIAEWLTPFGISPDAGNEIVYGGEININTAGLPVLMAMLPPESADLAQAIAEYRQEAIEDEMVDLFADPQWYRNAPGCGDLIIDPALITVASDLFRIEATAAIDARQLIRTAIVRRVQDRESGRWTAEMLRIESSVPAAGSEGFDPENAAGTL